MKNEFTAIIERDGEWYIAYCPEIPGANGQGRTNAEARKNLAEAIALILENRREEGIRARHGRPAGVLIGIRSEDDWFDYQLENDPRFLKRIEAARASIRSGKGVTLESRSRK